MNQDLVIPKALNALRCMDDISMYKRYDLCYAIFHDTERNEHKIFAHSTNSQRRKYLYNNVGSLKSGLRHFLETNIYEFVKTKYSWEDKDYISSEQLDELIKYLIDNNIIEIVHVKLK